TYADSPGYKHIKIMPHIGGGFSFAKANLKTYYGDVSSRWKVDSSEIIFDVEIPCNTRATIYVPAKNTESVKENNLPVVAIQKEGDYIVTEIGSGNYHFVINK
ncbi:MAG TPA: alpha-L-rhamnosidase C-terminal domain-containing protein, partial [Puia sp.]|nr:alpha-L-rhamnosidase C-terminal domain-containing protein [Puia sp.]